MRRSGLQIDKNKIIMLRIITIAIIIGVVAIRHGRAAEESEWILNLSTTLSA